MRASINAKPLSAAVGLAVVAAGGVRRLLVTPGGLAGSLRRRYDELAEHGRTVLGAAPAGASPDEPPPGLSLVGDSPLAAEPPFGAAEPVVLPERVERAVEALPAGADLDHADLPLADYDHLTLPDLRGRLRTLDAPSLVQLLDYEQAHADRLPVRTLIENRLASLTAHADTDTAPDR